MGHGWIRISRSGTSRRTRSSSHFQAAPELVHVSQESRVRDLVGLVVLDPQLGGRYQCSDGSGHKYPVVPLGPHSGTVELLHANYLASVALGDDARPHVTQELGRSCDPVALLRFQILSAPD